MKLRKIAIASLLSVIIAGSGHAQKINPMTQAVLQSYEEILQQNPGDYGTLYERAVLYFQMGRYDDALNDLAKAVQATPQKDKDMLSREYSLYADVCVETSDYKKALEMIDKALALTPDSYADIYRKGNIYMHLGNPEEAYKCYSRMQQFKSRSQEAYFGMAKACAAMNRNDEALALIKEAENAAPNDYLTYCRIGDLYSDLKSPQNAATNYISAFSLAEGDQVNRPLQSLLRLSQTNFPAVDEALTYIIGKVNNNMPLLFLRSNLAYESGNYQIAYDSFRQLLEIPEAREASVYSQLARTCLALNKTEEGMDAIEKAIAKEKNARYYNIKSEMALARKDPATALQAAKEAAALDEFSLDALTNKALALIAQGSYQEALQPLNEATMMYADSAVPLLIRGNLNKRHLGKADAAKADFGRVAANDAAGFPAIFHKALAKAWNGKQLDADTLIEEALKQDHSAETMKYAMAYYTVMGDLAKIQQLRQMGAANHNANDPDFAWIAVAEN